jgi:hypothetical protein
MDMSQSVVEKYRQKYPASKLPRYNPHTEREQAKYKHEITGWTESQTSQI